MSNGKHSLSFFPKNIYGQKLTSTVRVHAEILKHKIKYNKKDRSIEFDREQF